MNNSILPLFHKIKTLKSLKSIHAHLQIDASILSSDLILNKFIRLYFKYGEIDYARKLFDQIPEPNAFIWTSLIHGYVENRQFNDAYVLFNRMCTGSIAPLSFTISSVVKALGRESRIKDGECMYGFVLKSGFGFELNVQNGMIDLFMRCGRVDTAERVYNEMVDKDVVSWNSMIIGYGNNGKVALARKLFDDMIEKNVVSWTSMICGYVKAGDMVEANSLFETMPVKDTPSWNVMLSGYIDAGDIVNARQTFEAMPSHGLGTWNLMISGLCKAGDVESAREYFHKMPMKDEVSCAIMIDGYVKAGDIDGAGTLFDQMPQKNLVSWSIMIGGYAKNGQPHKALELFEDFKKQGIKPDETFVLGIISACSQLGIMDMAESAMDNYAGSSILSDFRVATSLIDMYAKCGTIDKALEVFEKNPRKDLRCYSTMLSAFANHGLGQEAIGLFNNMLMENIKPDGVSFLAVLTACNHGGLVNEGKLYFKQMRDNFGIQPTDRHYACMVDLLGRAGCLHEAYYLITSMSIFPTSVVWGALLAACRVHCNVQLAEVAAAELFKIEPDNSGNYILLSNIYAAVGKREMVAKVRSMIRDRRVKKNRGSSWIEMGCVVHEFVTADVSHKDIENIHLVLDFLSEEMKRFGYLMVEEEEDMMSPYTASPISLEKKWCKDESKEECCDMGGQ